MTDPLTILSAEAIEDFASILACSLRWGSARAEKTRRDLVHRLASIAAGESLGHRRADLDFAQPTRCLTVGVHVIVYNPDNRIVLRIIHARRDFRSLVEGRP